MWESQAEKTGLYPSNRTSIHICARNEQLYKWQLEEKLGTIFLLWYWIFPISHGVIKGKRERSNMGLWPTWRKGRDPVSIWNVSFHSSLQFENTIMTYENEVLYFLPGQATPVYQWVFVTWELKGLKPTWPCLGWFPNVLRWRFLEFPGWGEFELKNC